MKTGVHVNPNTANEVCKLPFAAVVLVLASCASAPLEIPALPETEPFPAHIGVVQYRHGDIDVDSWFEREISADITESSLSLGQRTFSVATLVTETDPPPVEVDLLLEAVSVTTHDTKQAWGWDDDTTTISVTWQLSERNGDTIWSETFSGAATNRVGPGDGYAKLNERIRVALRKILVDALNTIPDVTSQARMQTVLARVDDLREQDALVLEEREALEREKLVLLTTWQPGTVTIDEFRAIWDWTYGIELGIVALDASGGRITYHMGRSPLESVVESQSYSESAITFIKSQVPGIEASARAGENVTMQHNYAYVVCSLTFRNNSLQHSNCGELERWNPYRE